MRSGRPLLPTALVAVAWFLFGLVLLGVVLATHPPIPDGPILRSVATAQETTR
jgi:hypothetical protein